MAETLFRLPTGGEHPLVQLSKQCLANSPSQRPVAKQIISILERMRDDIDGPYGEIARTDALRQVVTKRVLRKRDDEVQKYKLELSNREVEIQQLHQELQEAEV